MYRVSRLDMGVYMCIAKNGIPPAVSKTIRLGIDCEREEETPDSNYSALINLRLCMCDPRAE